MPIPLSAKHIAALQTQGVSQEAIAAIQASDPPTDGSFHRIALNTPLSRQFKDSPPENQEFVLVDGKPFLIAAGLGKGGFGAVYQGINLETGAEVAIKFSNIPRDLGEEKAEIVNTERESLQRLGKLHAAAVGPSTVAPTDNYAALTVMELVHGQTLENMLYHQNDAGTMDKQNLDMLTKFFIGMEFLDSLHTDFHQNGILHRDIKPDNVFWNATTRKLSIIDYGENLHVQGPVPDDFAALNIKRPELSNSLYGAPELDKMATRAFSAKSDNFAAGLVLAEVFSNFNAMAFKDDLMQQGEFTTSAEQATRQRLASALMAPGEDAVSKVLFAAVVNNMLQVDPNRRGTLLDASVAIKKCAIGFLNKTSTADLGISEGEKQKILTHLNLSVAMNATQSIIENNSDFMHSHKRLSETLHNLVTTTRQRDLAGDNAANDRALFTIIQRLEKEVHGLSDRRDVSERAALLSLVDNLKSEPKMLLLQAEQFMQENQKFLGKHNVQERVEMLTARYAQAYETGMLQNPKMLQVISNNIGMIQEELARTNTAISPDLSLIFDKMNASLKLPEAVVRRAEDVPTAVFSSSSTSSSYAASSSEGTQPPEPQSRQRAFSAVPTLKLDGLDTAPKTVEFAAPDIRRSDPDTSETSMSQKAPSKSSSHEQSPHQLSRGRSRSMLPSFVRSQTSSSSEVTQPTTEITKSVRFKDDSEPTDRKKPSGPGKQ